MAGMGQSIVRQRIAVRIDRGATNEAFLNLQVRRERFRNTASLRNNFRANPVTGEQ
jgi:hypothetical protein